MTKKVDYFSEANIAKRQSKDDDGTNQKNIFIDQIIKLALEDKLFNDADVTSELKTIMLAVS